MYFFKVESLKDIHIVICCILHIMLVVFSFIRGKKNLTVHHPGEDFLVFV